MNDHELQLILSRFDSQDKRFDTQEMTLQRIEEHQAAQVTEHNSLSARVGKVETKVEERHTSRQWIVGTVIAILTAIGTLGAVFVPDAAHVINAIHALNSLK